MTESGAMAMNECAFVQDMRGRGPALGQTEFVR